MTVMIGAGGGACGTSLTIKRCATGPNSSGQTRSKYHALDDVLTPRTKRSEPDDFKISDLGFSHSLAFLANSERRDINKRIAHSTLPGSEPVLFRWDVFELVTKGVSQSLKFLDWVAEQKTVEQFQSWSSAMYCRARTKNIYDYFAATIKQPRGAKTITK